MNLERQMVAALRAHMRGGKPRPPDAGLLLWSAFNDLSGTRTHHAAGPNPISYAEIEAWCRLSRMPLAARHVAVIRAMDDAWIGHVSAVADDPKAAEWMASKAPISATAFDSMFP